MGRGQGQARLFAGHRGAQRHVLVKRLVRGHALGGKGLGLAHAIVAHIVVFDLVVVPGHEPGAVGMHGLQIRIALVQRIAVAVILQCCGMHKRLQPREMAAFLLGRRCGRGIFVDVIAEKDHQVGIVLAGMAPGGVVAMFPALAGGIDQAQLRHRSTGSRRSAGAAGGTGLALAVKAVVVPAAGLQALGQHMHAVSAVWAGHGLAPAQDLAELRIMGQLPVHLHRAQQGCAGTGQQPRPQHHAAGIGLATGHAQAKQLLRDRPRRHGQRGVAACLRDGRQLGGQAQGAQALQPLAPVGVLGQVLIQIVVLAAG